MLNFYIEMQLILSYFPNHKTNNKILNNSTTTFLNNNKTVQYTNNYKHILQIIVHIKLQLYMIEQFGNQSILL